MRNIGLKFTFPLMFWYQLYWLYMIWEVFPPLFSERVCIKLCISFLNAWKNSQCGHLGLIFVCFHRKVLVYGFSFFDIELFIFSCSYWVILVNCISCELDLEAFSDFISTFWRDYSIRSFQLFWVNTKERNCGII